MRGGISRVEVLVIIAILATLTALLVPARRNVREAAARTQCVNNLKQMMLAMHGYCDAHKSKNSPDHFFPPACVGQGANPEERLSWMVEVLAYLDHGPHYSNFDVSKGFEANRFAAGLSIGVFRCPNYDQSKSPETIGFPLTNYVAMSGIGGDSAVQPAGTKGNGFIGYERLTSMAMIKDGASNTIALMETCSDMGPWARGGNSTLRCFDPDVPLDGDSPPFSGHERGFNVAMVDGSVRIIRPSIDLGVLAAAITIADDDETPNLD